jgi:flagellar hook-associated protein 2
MAGISSPGIGSGLDINSLVSQLVSLEAQPPTNRYNREESSLQTRLSGLGIFKGAVSSLNSSLASLTSAATFQGRKASSSDSDVLTASASSIASEGVYDIDVTTLAKAHTLVTDTTSPFATTTESIGTGSITIKFGTTDYDSGTDTYNSFTQNTGLGTHNITIDSSNDSLEGIRDAINEADIGVRASIINNGSGYLLSFVSENAGADNSIQVTTSTTTGDLSVFDFNGTATNMEQTRAAQDTALTINGVAITSESNSITSAIEGVTLDLLATGTSTLTVSHNKGAVTSAINSFVKKYNDYMSTVDQLTGYDPDTQKAGILIGDAGVRSITNQVQNYITGLVDGLTGPFTSLATLGITTKDDGGLEVNSATLSSALEDNFDDVAALFAALGQPSDSLIDFVESGDDTQVGEYAVNITQLATQGSIEGTDGTRTDLQNHDGSGNFLSDFVVDADNDTFTIVVDGVTANSVTLTQGNYTTASDLAAEIEAQINGDDDLVDNGITVDVSFDNATSTFTITSSSYGSDSTIGFTSVDTNTADELGFSASLTGTDGVDVAGTIGGVTATGAGQQLTGSGDADGLVIEITGGATGDRGTVNFTRGIADQLSSYMQGVLDDELIDQRVDSINDELDRLDEQRATLNRRLATLEERLYSQFSALDVLVNQLQSTSSFLSSQLASLPTIKASGS